MYEIILNIIDHAWVTGDNSQSYIIYICGAMILMLTSVFIDLIYRVFRGIWSR